MKPLQIHCIPAFEDNYIWLLHQHGASTAWVVDPGDAKPVLDRLAGLGLDLEGVLLTHHHGDHDGGIPALKQAFPTLRVICGPDSQSAHGNEMLENGQSFQILGEAWQMIAVPGHTLDHVAFYCPGQKALFCGDTLFAAGCGRVFEGQPAQMHDSLQKLAALPPATRVYCAHEYTLANLKFALAVEPESAALQARMERCQQLRQQKLSTVPSSIEEELATNPFLRCQQANVQAVAAQRLGLRLSLESGQTPNLDAEVFACLRQWKNEFR